jgi:hypothetical protein
MFGSFLQPQFLPCPDCGASVPADKLDEHVCAREPWIDYQMFQLRGEVACFDIQLAAYLTSPQGRFDTYYAERQRLRSAA